MDGQLEIYWNWTVAVYLFVAGVSAGAFAISAIAYFFGEEKYEKITKIGAYIAPFPLIFGILCLIYDLERPFLFWKLLLTIQFNSVMSLGAWLLLIFSLMTFLHFYLWLPEKFTLIYFLSRLPERYHRNKTVKWLQANNFLRRFHQENLIRNRGLVAGWGIPVSIGVGIYTGVLLGALNARPFWNNPMLPFLFLLSAMKTGTAAICFVGCFLNGSGKMPKEEMETNKFMIHSIDFTLMVFSLIAVFLFILGLYVSPRSSVEAAQLVMGGDFTFLFWVIAVGVGILFPMALETYELIPHFIKRVNLREHKPWISGMAASSVLLGGLILRYVIVYAGQMAQVIAS